MTTKPTVRLGSQRLDPLPDPPPKGFIATRHLVLPGVPNIVARHLGALTPDTSTLVSGNGYVCRNRADFAGHPSPNLIIAFNVDCDSIIKTNGYVVDEVGKPPDLVLEVGSPSNGRSQYAEQRKIYEDLGVPEFWSFDHTGGDYQYAPLSFKRLSADGKYHTAVLAIESDGVIWGYSEALGLSLCWVEGRLRYWDRAHQRYLRTQQESEARVQELEAELRRREGS